MNIHQMLREAIFEIVGFEESKNSFEMWRELILMSVLIRFKLELAEELVTESKVSDILKELEDIGRIVRKDGKRTSTYGYGSEIVTIDMYRVA